MRIALRKMCLVFALAFFIQPFAASAEGLPVAVSILPQRYFVEKIGGNLVKTEVMAPPGQHPKNMSPSPGRCRP